MKKAKTAALIASVAVIAAITAASTVLAITGYSKSAPEFSHTKWVNAAPNERMMILDSLLSKLNTGDTKTGVKRMLGTPDAVDGNVISYRLTSSPFSPSEWLILSFDGDDKLAGIVIGQREGIAE